MMKQISAVHNPDNSSVLSVSNFTFYLYLLYNISFFLHLTARLPAIAILRPDLLMAAWLMLLLFLQQDKLVGRLDNSCNRYLTIFMIYIFLSLPLVEWPGSVLRENLAEFIKAFLFFYFTVLIVDTDIRLRRFVFVFMACQIFRVLEPLYLHEVYGYWGDRTYLGGGEFAGRLGGAPSDVINPNGLGFVIATLFPFLHYLWGSSGWLLKMTYLSLVAPLVYALVLTMSRSGLIAFLTIVWSIFVKSRHKIILILAAVLIAAMAWNNMNDVQRDRYLSMTGTEDVQGASTFQGRIDGLKKELDVALKKPVVGYGLGTSQEAIVNIGGGRHVSHNLYLETLIETGIIGLVLFMLFIHSIYQSLQQTAANLRNIVVSEPEKPDIKSFLIKAKTTTGTESTYEMNLQKALMACFWMYLIFSIAQYGLSEYHWYFMAGISTVLNRRTRQDQADNTDNNKTRAQ